MILCEYRTEYSQIMLVFFKSKTAIYVVKKLDYYLITIKIDNMYHYARLIHGITDILSFVKKLFIELNKISKRDMDDILNAGIVEFPVTNKNDRLIQIMNKCK